MEKKETKNTKPKSVSVDKKKNTKKTEKTGSDKAKKAPNGYILFGNEVREEFKKDGSEQRGAKETMKEISVRWNALSKEDKEAWNNKSKAMNDKLKAEAENEAGKSSVPRNPSKPDVAKEVKEPKKGNAKKEKVK